MSREEYSIARPGTAGQAIVRQGKAWHCKAKQGRALQGREGHCNAGQDIAKQSTVRALPGRAGLEQHCIKSYYIILHHLIL